MGIILALAIIGFFVGWVQLALASDTFGVVFTRTHGFEEAAIPPQGFSWRWERLVPGALTLYRFPLKAQSMDLTIKGSLPSGETYATVTAEKPDFSFEISLSVSFRLRPAALPKLADSTHLRPEGIAEYYKVLTQGMQSRALSIALAAPITGGESNASGNPEAIAPFANSDVFSRLITSELPGFFPEIEFLSLAPFAVRIPDLALYERLRSVYLNVVTARENALKASAARLVTQEADQQSTRLKQEQTLASLEKYGELLDKHPGLIKLLFLTTSKGFTAQDLQTLDLLDKLNGPE
jgi:hypothetical protein